MNAGAPTLRQVRQEQRLTMRALAAASEVDYTTIWRAEHGRSRILPVVRRSIAHALNRTPDQIRWERVG